MSELCLFIGYSLKVLVVVSIVELMGWGSLGAFRWWQNHGDDEFWSMWKKWLIISAIAFVAILVLWVAIPVTACKPVEVSNIPYYAQ